MMFKVINIYFSVVHRPLHSMTYLSFHQDIVSRFLFDIIPLGNPYPFKLGNKRRSA